MQNNPERQTNWSNLQQDWDLIIVGGGITGAGIFRLACSGGLKTLLIDAADFSSGTSSKSSKLVHGGFRYLRNHQYDVTFESVRQREQLLKQAPHLVSPMGFYLPYSDSHHKRIYRMGVTIYDLMAPKWRHRRLGLRELDKKMPLLKPNGMQGAFLYYDAVLDDARMVLRLIQEGIAEGGTALNYLKANALLFDARQQVRGVAVQDQSDSGLGTLEINARCVINATGPWTDELRKQVSSHQRVRPLRGSHLVFHYSDLPIPFAVTLMHPKDGRAMFAIPWEGRTIFGTTDLDHKNPLQDEPYCSNEEILYMLEAVNSIFPSVDLDQDSVISSFAGLRPIVRGDASNPSAESRAHLVLAENGLITVTGGKLTIFEIMAADALKAALPSIKKEFKPGKNWFAPLPDNWKQGKLCEQSFCYLAGRYGQAVDTLLSEADTAQLQQVDDLYTVWAELGFNTRHGMVEHLDDLMLRRTRLGLLLPEGAMHSIDVVRSLVQQPLGWDDQRWQYELQRYQNIYNRAYSPNPESFQE